MEKQGRHTIEGNIFRQISFRVRFRKEHDLEKIEGRERETHRQA